MDGATSFGSWLRQRRRALDMTQADLAARVGCSEITIRKLESDERMPSRQVAGLLAQGLELAEHERAAFVAFARGRLQFATTVEPAGHGPAPAAPGSAERLPLPLTRLVGREQELAQICATLARDDVRILTLVGPPGIGKTRLSLEAAAMFHDQQGDRFRDGVVFVPLAPVSDAGLVLDAMAQALHVGQGGGRTLIEQLSDAVREQALLLVLDNFEHVLAAATQLVRLLTACPNLKVLATSRAALHIRGEHLLPVAPLALPNLAWPLSTAELARSPAVKLFVERAQAVQPRFALNGENAATVAAICARLDGLPLAIELVAASSRLLSPLALLSRLGQPLGLLVAGPSDLPQRHQTLRAAIAWSYGLLAPAEQRLYQRLGVFVGDYDLEAITEICADTGPTSAALAHPLTPASIVDTLDVLIDHSLVSDAAPGEGEPRFTMLETIREYALEQLGAGGELAALRDRHARYYLALAEQAEPHLSGAQQDSWLDRLEREHDQFRSALAWCLSGAATRKDDLALSPRPVRQDRRVFGLRLGAALWRFWHVRCHLREGRRWLEALLAADESMRPARVRVLLGSGILNSAQGDTEQARALLERCMAEARRHGDDESLALARYHLGTIMHNQGEIEPAIAALEQCLSIQRAREDIAGVANALNGLGNLLFGRDDARAVTLLQESVALQRRLGNTRGIAFTLHSLGYACLLQGRPLAAMPHFHEALLLFMQLGDKIGIADCLSGLAAVAGGQLQHEYAAQLWLAAEQLRDAIGAPLASAERAEYERYLDPKTLNQAQQGSSGESPAPEQVIAEAIALVGEFSA